MTWRWSARQTLDQTVRFTAVRLIEYGAILMQDDPEIVIVSHDRYRSVVVAKKYLSSRKY